MQSIKTNDNQYNYLLETRPSVACSFSYGPMVSDITSNCSIQRSLSEDKCEAFIFQTVTNATIHSKVPFQMESNVLNDHSYVDGVLSLIHYVSYR